MSRSWIYFIISIIIYVIPGIAIWSVAINKSPIQPAAPAVRSFLDLFLIPMVIAFLLMLWPIVSLIVQPFITIPYFVLSYGLLYYFYRRQKKQISKA